MAKVNVPTKYPLPKTHEGAAASRITPVQELERTVSACLLWEDNFYESGVDVAKRIADLVPKVDPAQVAGMAVHARTMLKLRHAPLLLAREMARHATHRGLVAELLPLIIDRADELTEFLALYWKDEPGRPLSAQVKKGLAAAFTKFDAYQLAKYDRPGAVRLKDVLFLSHAKPLDATQDALWKQLIAGTLPAPNTWESRMAAGQDKKEVFTDLLQSGKLGYMALLRNLRGMTDAGVPDELIKDAILARRGARMVLPFRFLTAARHAARFEAQVEQAFLAEMQERPKLPGKTVVVVDVSGSMYGSLVSKRGEMDRAHAACALAAVLRECCEDVQIYATAGSDYAREHKTALVPARRGIALADAIYAMSSPLGGGGIFLAQVADYISTKEKDVTRVIVITDEQDCDHDNSPENAKLLGEHNYILNVGTYKNGIAYKRWTHVSGFSESVVAWIYQYEGITAPVAETEEQ